MPDSTSNNSGGLGGDTLLLGMEAICRFYGTSRRPLMRMVRKEGFPARKGADGKWRAIVSAILRWETERTKAAGKTK